jgi:hypothetical protein
MGWAQGLKTGDLVIFSDRYWITSHLTRWATRSQWTHIGMVVRLVRNMISHGRQMF